MAIMSYDEVTSSIITRVVGNSLATEESPKWVTLASIREGVNNGFPNIEVFSGSENNQVEVVWVNGDDATNKIMSISGTDPVVHPPSNFTVVQHTQDFGIFTETYNELKWTDSTSESVTFYGIYRDGVYVEDALPGEESLIDHNQQPVTTTYKIIAFDFDGCASFGVSAQVLPLE